MSRSVLVTSVLVESPVAVFTGLVAGEEHTRRFVSPRTFMRAPIAGETWNIGGKVSTHPLHGEQIIIDAATLEKPSGDLVIHLLSSARFPDVGRATARKLWDTFGEELYRLLELTDEESIAAATGNGLRGRRQAATIIDGWASLAVEIDVLAWLDRHGVHNSIAFDVMGCLGKESVARLTEDPYRLIVFGSDWKQADRIARSLNVEADDPRRLVAAVEHGLHRRFSSAGDTWVPGPLLSEDVGRLIGQPLANTAIEAARRCGAIEAVPGGWQAAGPAALESYVAREIVRRCNVDAAAASATMTAEGDISEPKEFTLNAEQRTAVGVACTAPFSILTGGAGTGKTATLRAIADTAIARGECVLAMALSGRAAVRVSEATGLKARTIAGFLQIYEGSRERVPSNSLVVIDEASMVDLTQLYRILAVLPERARLLLVGDAGQLPPIGPGLTLHALVEEPGVPCVKLVEIMRQSAASGIPQAGMALRSGAIPPPLLDGPEAPGLSFIDAAPAQIVDEVVALRSSVEHGAVQVIVAHKGNAADGCGTRRINAVCHSRVVRPTDLLFERFHIGEPVIWMRNDHDRALMNGDLGVVIGADEEADALRVDFTGREIRIPRIELGDLELAYAITVHKSQGSGFDYVIIPIMAHHLLDRTLLYTALTRAKKRVVLIGDRQAFNAAVLAEPSSSRRRSMLGWHLKAARDEIEQQGRN